MSFESHLSSDEVITNTVLDIKSLKSFEEPPMEEWSSLIFFLEPHNEKRLAFKEGLYSPGSGELCPKYLGLSDSSLFRHPYYWYPRVEDPGVEEALLHPEPRKEYDNDGQELYLDLCKQSDQYPVKLFYRNLINDKIDLKYYCIDPLNVRAMSRALYLNNTVQSLDLTDNILNNDACFHLGEMLLKNSTLAELILNGCRIGLEGAERVIRSLTKNRTLITIDLSRNVLYDDFVAALAEVIHDGIGVQRLFLRNNKITSNGAAQLALALESHNNITHFDISWNQLYSPVGVSNLVSSLCDNTKIQELRLTNNSLYGQRVATAIRNLIAKAPDLSLLDISNNMFFDDDINIIIRNLSKAKKLHTLNLSTNQFSINTAIQVLSKLRFAAVKVQYLLLDHMDVNEEFMAVLKKIKNLKFRKDAVITHGRVVGTIAVKSKDPRDVILDRAEFLCSISKRDKVDLGLLLMKCLKENGKILVDKEFGEFIRKNGAALDQDLVNEIVNVFAGTSSKKMKTINIENVVDYVKRKWPDKALPPSPHSPPAPAPP